MLGLLLYQRQSTVQDPIERIVEIILMRKRLGLNWTTSRLREELGYLLSDEAFCATSPSSLAIDLAYRLRDGRDEME